MYDKYDKLVMSNATNGYGDGDGVATSELSVDSMALWVEASSRMKKRSNI